MNTIKILWMDETVHTYPRVVARSVDGDAGQLTLTVAQRQAVGQPEKPNRVINIPLGNVRWWGDPGEEVAW